MLIYFLRGTLPWRKIRAPNAPPLAPPDSSPSSPQKRPQHPYNPVSATWNLIRDAKVKAEPLLTMGLPQEFDILYRYARGLEFDDLPDYEGLRRLFRGLAAKVGVEYDGEYDWSVPDGTNGKRGGGRRSTSEGDTPGVHGNTHTSSRRYCAACNSRR